MYQPGPPHVVYADYCLEATLAKSSVPHYFLDPGIYYRCSTFQHRYNIAIQFRIITDPDWDRPLR